MKVSRRPSQVFNFKEAENFVDAIKGKNQVVVYVGRVKAEDGTETWKAFYWEPTDQTSSHSWSTEGRAVLPPGSVAWLDMETEYDLEWTLRDLQDEFRKYNAVTKEVQAWSQKIQRVNRSHKFANDDVFKYMSIPEKEKLIAEMKLEYEKLMNKGSTKFELPAEETDDEVPREDDEE